jgi:3-oxoacyl-[acyl-carrier protein] reductase
MAGRLDGKVAIVTGGASGIGAAVTRRFACDGAKVAINVLDLDSDATELREALLAAGHIAELFRADVSRSDQVKRMIMEVHEQFGLIDVLVNNAGVYPRADWRTLSEEAWDRVIDVDLKGQFLCAQTCYVDMIERGGGKIINVGSNLALLGRKELAHYIAAKAGTIGLTRALAKELGEFGVCVNCILPGAIQVKRELELYSDQEALHKRVIERQCIKRRGMPEDVVGLFSFLASSESDFITGQTIVIDGGIALG